VLKCLRFDPFPVGLLDGSVDVGHQQHPDGAAAGVFRRFGELPAITTGAKVGISRTVQPPCFVGVSTGRVPPRL
jgi:hypothetical protein